MGVPICPEEYEDYDPNDIPTDQAEPTPDCVPEDQQDEGMNPQHLSNGIPICPSEELPGYEYPVPEVPFTLPPKLTTTTTIATTTTSTTATTTTTTTTTTKTTSTTTTETLPECILSEEQNSGKNPEYLDAGVPLCPSEEVDGYEYPVPENPLTLPPKTTTTVKPLPECVPSDEKDLGENPSYIAMGVPLCPEEYEDYDPNGIPSDQAEPAPDCVPEDQKNEGINPEHLSNGIPLCPSEELPGYEYPVPEIPFTLPPKPSPIPTTLPTTTTTTPTTTLPDCIPET